jgi:hypothetical protein
MHLGLPRREAHANAPLSLQEPQAISDRIEGHGCLAQREAGGA